MLHILLLLLIKTKLHRLFKVATLVGKEQCKCWFFNMTFSCTVHHGIFYPNGSKQAYQNNLLEWLVYFEALSNWCSKFLLLLYLFPYLYELPAEKREHP